MVDDKVNPYDLDWGMVTTDGFNEEQNTLLLVFNIDMSLLLNINRSMTFLIGRSLWLNRHAPGINQKIVIDLRGQSLALLSRAREFKNDLLNSIGNLNGQIIMNIEILI